jgi:recombination protein RecT
MADNYSIIKSYAKSSEIQGMFAGIVGENRASSYLYSVIIAVSQSPQLQQCTPQSIMRSAARAATLGLSVDPNIGQAYLVPYKGEATFQAGWRGLRDMAYRTGKIANINVGVVAEGQQWVQDQMTGYAKIEGMPTSNKPIGYFAYMKTFSGREHFEYMTKEQVIAHKEQYAQGYQSKYSPWVTAFDKMAKKTVLKQLLGQWAEMDPSGVEIASVDDAVESIDELPEPSQVTVVEAPRRSNEEIIKELGFDQALDAIEAEFKEVEIVKEDEPEPEPEPEQKPRVKVVPRQQRKPQPKPEPEPEPEKEADTSAPGSSRELYSWIAQGALPGIGVKAARLAVQEANGEIDIAWEVLRAMSKDQSEQPGLL